MSMTLEAVHLSLKGLTKVYGNMVAVADLNLDIRYGEFVTVLGPSGSGKTTTLMIIAGFVPCTRGAILLDGADITFLPPYKRNIGMVFQNYSLFPHMTVTGNIAFPLKMRYWEPVKIASSVAQILAVVKLTGLEGRYPSQLSGGQQQRVALARALVFEPRVLLMDEPLGALDKQLREHMQLEIKQIQRDLGITVVYVTHDQTEALVMSDRIAVMNTGHLEQVDTPARLYEYPQTKFVAGFVGASNFFRGTTECVKDDVATIRVAGGVLVEVNGPTLEAGEPVEIGIRPERISFRSSSGPAPNLTDGVVTNISFEGESIKYLIDAPPGKIMVTIQNSLGSSWPQRGERVTVGWERESVRVIQGGRQSGIGRTVGS